MTPPRRKAQALLAYLALSEGQAHPRDKLAALLWGEVPAPRARHSLRQALLEVRRALPPGGLVDDGRTVAIERAALEVDVRAFERLAAAGTPEALARAADLYRGDLLQGLGAQDPGFEEWLLVERERLRELAQDALAALVAHHTQMGAPEPAIRAALRLIGLDPTAEPAHRALMRLHAEGGRRGAALRQYQACVDALRRELDAEPEAETRELYRALLRAAPADPGPGAGAAAPGSSAPAGSPLVGRDAELARIRAAWEAAAGGSGRVVALLGDAGIGKSRLAAELVAEALDQGAAVLAGRAYEAEQVLPFGPWTDAIREGRALPAAGDSLGPGFRAELTRLFPELGAPGSPRSGEHVVRLFEALAQLLRAVAATRPALVILEDMHWADDLSVRLLGFLARRVPDWPLLVVVTARQEDLTGAALLSQVLDDLEADRRVIAIPLSPLGRPDAEALVRSLARVGTDPPALGELQARVWAASEGNPFVIVEAVRAFADGELGPGTARPALPDTVRRALGQRLRRLPERARHVAAVAAVIGREVDFHLLRRAADLSAGACAEAVEALVARRVLHVAGERLAFTHDRVRETAYAELLPPSRQALHAMVGRALEEAYRGRHAEVADRLGAHFAQADDADRAVGYLALAAERASQAYAHADAVNRLDEALRLTARLPAAAQDRWIVDLALRQGLALTFLGRFREVRERLEPLQPRVDRLADPAVAGAFAFRLAMTAGYLGDQTEAARHGAGALEAARASANDALAGQAHYVLGLASYYRGRPAAGLQHGRQAMLRLDRTPDLMWRGLVRVVPAVCHGLLGAFDRALEALAEMEAIGAEIGDPRLRSMAATYTGWILASQGDGPAGVEACERGVALAADPVTLGLAESRLGQAWLEQGDAGRAIPPLLRALQAMDRFRFRPLEVSCTLLLGEARLLAGDRALAEDLVHRGLLLAREDDSAFWVAWGERALGRLARTDGALDAAAARLQAALGAFRAVPAPLEEARTLLLLADVAAARGDAADRETRISAARERFAALGLARADRAAVGSGPRRGVPGSTP